MKSDPAGISTEILLKLNQNHSFFLKRSHHQSDESDFCPIKSTVGPQIFPIQMSNMPVTRLPCSVIGPVSGEEPVSRG